MLIYRVAEDDVGDVGCFSLVRKGGYLVWEWVGFEKQVRSGAPKLDRIIRIESYTVEHPSLHTPFLESDI